MDNKNMNITDLIKKYEQVRYMNKKFYFDADEFVAIANYYIQKKDNLEAETAADLGLAIHPYSSKLMMVKAKVLTASKKHEVAYNYLLTIVEDETDVDLLLLKFECLIKLNRIKEANAYLEYILEGDLSEADSYTFVKKIAYLYNDAESFETAIVLLEKALKVDNTNTNVLIELAYAYEMNGNMEKAIDITNRIIDLDPYSFDAWVSLGRLYLYNFEYDLSIEAYDFALAIKESDVEVLKLKAITYSEGFDFENELKVLNECIDASPDDESLYEEILKKYKEFEDYWGMDQDEGILKVLEKKEAQFGSTDLLLRMAHLNLRINEVDKAQEIYTRIPEEYKNSVDYYKLQGDFAIHHQDYVAAEIAYIKALKESPQDLEVLNNLAEISADLDKQEKAAKYLEQIIAIDPEYGIVNFRLAIVRFEIGEKEPFDKIINQIADKKQLEMLANMFSSFTSRKKKEKIDYTQLSREELLILLDKSREGYLQLRKARGEEF